MSVQTHIDNILSQVNVSHLIKGCIFYVSFVPRVRDPLRRLLIRLFNNLRKACRFRYLRRHHNMIAPPTHPPYCPFPPLSQSQAGPGTFVIESSFKTCKVCLGFAELQDRTPKAWRTDPKNTEITRLRINTYL